MTNFRALIVGHFCKTKHCYTHKSKNEYTKLRVFYDFLQNLTLKHLLKKS